MNEKRKRGQRRMADVIKETLAEAGYRLDVAEIIAILEKNRIEREEDVVTPIPTYSRNGGPCQ